MTRTMGPTFKINEKTGVTQPNPIILNESAAYVYYVARNRERKVLHSRSIRTVVVVVCCLKSLV